MAYKVVHYAGIVALSRAYVGHKVFDVVAVAKAPQGGVAFVTLPKVKDVAVPAIVAALKRQQPRGAVGHGWLDAGQQLCAQVVHVADVLLLGMEHLDTHHVFLRSLLDCCSHLQGMMSLFPVAGCRGARDRAWGVAAPLQRVSGAAVNGRMHTRYDADTLHDDA